MYFGSLVVEGIVLIEVIYKFSFCEVDMRLDFVFFIVIDVVLIFDRMCYLIER